MNTITYKTETVKIEKVIAIDPTIGQSADNPLTYKTITKYRGYTKVPVPYTFGLIRKWIRCERLDSTEELAVASAAAEKFRYFYPIKNKAPRTVVETMVDDVTDTLYNNQ